MALSDGFDGLRRCSFFDAAPARKERTSCGKAVVLSDNVEEVLHSCQSVLAPSLLMLSSKPIHLCPKT